MVPAAEADVGRPRLRHVNVFGLFAGFVKNSDAVATDVNVAPLVNGHAVGDPWGRRGFCWPGNRRAGCRSGRCWPAPRSETKRVLPSGAPVMPLGCCKSPVTRARDFRSADRR